MQFLHKNDFPVLRNNPQLIYLDYAATTFMPDDVLEEKNDYDATVGVSINRGVGLLSQKAEDCFYQSTNRIKSFWNAKNYELVYTKNATESLNLLAAVASSKVDIGDIILLSEYEHHSNLLPWQRIAKQKGACIVSLPINSSGELNYDLLEILPKERVKVISLSLLSNVTGYALNWEKIKAYIHASDIFWILDVSQAVAHLPLDFEKFAADAYCMSAHKMYGPKNIGGCFIHKRKIDSFEPYMLGGGMVWNIFGGHPEWHKGARKFAAGTFDVALVRAWDTSCRYISKIGFPAIMAHEKMLHKKFLAAFADDDRIRILPSGIGDKSLCAFEMRKYHSHDIATMLSTAGFEIRTGHMCSQNALRAFHKNSVCRVSWGIGTEEADMDRFISELRTMVGEIDG